MASYIGTNLPRGIRNNNPGNLVKTGIKWNGEIEGDDSRFETFKSIEFGTRAMMLDILHDLQKPETNTISKFIKEYAPPHENNTLSYINFVSTNAGVSPNVEIVKVTKSLLIAVSKAIVSMENGRDALKYVTDKVLESAYNMIDEKKKQAMESK